MKRFGECSIAFEPPDLVVTVLDGAMTADLANAMYDEYERLEGEGTLPHFSLILLRSFSVATIEVRRIAMGRARVFRVPAATVICGGSFAIRVIPSMFFRALSILDARYRESPVRFFEHEAEGRAWIAAAKVGPRSRR